MFLCGETLIAHTAQKDKDRDNTKYKEDFIYMDKNTVV